MELFSLLAKLTLDASEFNKEISNAEKQAGNFSVNDPKLGLDKSEFDDAINQAENVTVSDPEEPELDLDTSGFDTAVTNAESVDISDPDEPSLDLDTSDFDTEVTNAEATVVDDPAEPSLGLDTSDFSQSLTNAETESSSFSTSVQSIFNNLGGVIAGLGIAATVTGIVNTLKEGVELAKNHGDAIDKQSQKMGISAKAYQEWSYALNLSGASIDDLNRGLRTWQQAAGDEEAVAKLSDAFGALGIDAEDAFKKIENGENLDTLLNQVMYGLADKSSGDRGWIAEALFGKNATQLNALFNQTSQEIRDAKEEANDLGMIMTDEEVKNAAAYMDATTRLEGALNGIKEAFAANILPLLTDAANTVAKIIAFFNPRTGQKSLSEQFAGDDEEFAKELVTIEGTAAAAETLADKLLAMGDTSEMTASQYAIWKGTADELIKLVPTLGDVIDTESGKINANSEEIKNNIKQWENLAKQKALQTLKEKKYQEIVEANEKLVDKSIEANKKAADAEAARRTAAEKFSQKMQEYGLGSLDMNGDIDQQISDVMSRLSEGGEQYESELLGLGVALKEFGEASTEAGKAQAEADKLAKELEEGEKEYQAWVEAAERLYGGLESNANGAIQTVNELQNALRDLPGTVSIGVTYHGGAYTRAIGDSYIPFDNFPALLHRGERVMTATEARQERQNTGNYSDLEDRIVAAINRGMENANVTAIVTDRQVAKGSNRYNGNELDSRRFLP